MVPRCALFAWALVSCGASASAQELAGAFDSPSDALKGLLRQGKQVIAFGEYHQTHAKKDIPSPLSRFTRQILPQIIKSTTDVILETWITDGECGEKEETVQKDVETTTQRPETTENELVTLIKRVKEGGATPHILIFKCADYKALLDEKGEVDYEKLLLLITDKLRKKAILAYELNAKTKGKLVVLYGGALHNDIYPREELSRYTFGGLLRRTTASRYLEIDLYVPEYIDGDAELAKEAWFPIYRKNTSPKKTLLIRRGADSYILIFPRQAPLSAAPTPAGSPARATP